MATDRDRSLDGGVPLVRIRAEHQAVKRVRDLHILPAATPVRPRARVVGWAGCGGLCGGERHDGSSDPVVVHHDIDLDFRRILAVTPIGHGAADLALRPSPALPANAVITLGYEANDRPREETPDFHRDLQRAAVTEPDGVALETDVSATDRRPPSQWGWKRRSGIDIYEPIDPAGAVVVGRRDPAPADAVIECLPFS